MTPQKKHKPDNTTPEGLDSWFLDLQQDRHWEDLHIPRRVPLWRLGAWLALGVAGLLLWSWATAPAAPGLELSAMVSGGDDWERLSRPSPRYQAQARQSWAASYSEEANFSGDALPLPAPHPGSWLYEHPEAGQTWHQYKAQANNRRSESRHTIYVAPLGPLRPQSARVLQITAEYLDAYYDTRTVIMDPVALPLRAWDSKRRQYNARTLLDCLRMNVPDDALGVITLTEADLFIPSTHHVFGLGSFEHQVAVVSLYRFGDDFTPEGQRGTVLRRTLTAASHEFGHVLSMRHCTAFVCLMNGTNSLQEADAHPLHLCPDCQRKASHAMGFHRQDRFARLLDFYERYRFLPETAFVERRLDPPEIEFLPDP